MENCHQVRFRDFFFHQNNSPIHTSAECKQLIEYLNIRWVKAPSQSPDLNPIDYLWNDMYTFIQYNMCNNLNDVRRAIGEYTRNLLPQKCARFIGQLHRVIRSLLKY